MSIGTPKENPGLRASIRKQLDAYANSPIYAPELQKVDLEKAADFFTEKAEEQGITEPHITFEEVGLGQSNFDRTAVGRDREFVLRDTAAANTSGETFLSKFPLMYEKTPPMVMMPYETAVDLARRYGVSLMTAAEYEAEAEKLKNKTTGTTDQK